MEITDSGDNLEILKSGRKNFIGAGRRKFLTHSTFNDTFPQQCGCGPIVLQMLQITALAVALSPILRLSLQCHCRWQPASKKRCKTLHFADRTKRRPLCLLRSNPQWAVVNLLRRPHPFPNILKCPQPAPKNISGRTKES